VAATCYSGDCGGLEKVALVAIKKRNPMQGKDPCVSETVLHSASHLKKGERRCRPFAAFADSHARARQATRRTMAARSPFIFGILGV
jgi:hypothetical protein